MTLNTRWYLMPALALLLAATALPGPRGGGAARASSRSSVNRNQNVNRNANVNRIRTVNGNRNVDVNGHGGYYDGGYYGGGCRHSNPMVTAAVIGSVVNTVPPSVLWSPSTAFPISSAVTPGTNPNSPAATLPTS